MYGLGINRLGTLNTSGSGSGVPSITDLFSNGENGFWYDASDTSVLFTDTAGTTAVTVVGQEVKRINDKSGNGNHLVFETDKYPRYSKHPTTGSRNRLADSNTLARASSNTDDEGFRGWENFANLNSATTDSTTSPRTGADSFKIYKTASQEGIYISWKPRGVLFTDDNETHTLSVYFKPTGNGTQPVTDLMLLVGQLQVFFDVSAGTYALAGITSNHSSSSVTDAGNGWYLLKTTVSNMGNDNIAFFGVDSTGTFGTFNGETSEFLLSAPQFEVGSSRTTFQTTTSLYNVTEPNASFVYSLTFEGNDYGMFDTSETEYTYGNFVDNISVIAGVSVDYGSTERTIIDLSENPPAGSNAKSRLYIDNNEFKHLGGGGTYTTVVTSDVGGALSFPIKASVFTGVDMGTDTNTISLGSQGHSDSTTSDLGSATFHVNIPDIEIGASNIVSTASNQFKGKLHQLVLVERLLTATEQTAMSVIVDNKVGV